MEQNQGNHKALFTKRLLAKAFLDLLKEKDPNSLTVAGLCEKAGVSRTSFYRNYHSVDDVFEFYIKDRIDGYLGQGRRLEREDSFRGEHIDLNILELWGRDRDFVRLIDEKGLLNDFIMIICRYMTDILLQSEGHKDLFDEEKYKIVQYRSALQAYYTGAVLYAWAQRGLSDDRAEILEVLARIRTEGISEGRHPLFL